MKDFGPGFPEWTELGQDGGLDPLGMQRPIEAIYQSLLPGISTITLRFRYYSFFPWILEVYARNEHNTDPAAFRVFQRRCETLFALICCRGDQELGVAGIDWAQKQLSAIEDQSVETTLIDFAAGADPEPAPAAPEALILDIATRHFFVETLDTRNRDRLDFHDVAVWAMRAALNEACLGASRK